MYPATRAMVASSRSRKNSDVVSAELISKSSNSISADGRRQLFGLSRAIREKAFQSTTPRSESDQHKVDVNQPFAMKKLTPASEKQKVSLSVEDRLKSLFNSDAEEPSDKSLHRGTKKLRTKGLELKKDQSSSSRNNENPHLSKTKTVEYDETINERLGAFESPSVLHVVPDRCASALPPSYNEHTRNSRVRSRTSPFPLEEHQQDYHRTSRRVSAGENQKLSRGKQQRPNSTGPSFFSRSSPHQHKKVAFAASRGSLNFENENESTDTHMPPSNQCRTSNPIIHWPHFSHQAHFSHQGRMNPEFHPNPFSFSVPDASFPQPTSTNQMQADGPTANIRNSDLVQAYQSGRTDQEVVAPYTFPEPATQHKGPLELARESASKLHRSRGHLQHNSSFRRAVCGSLNSESDRPKLDSSDTQRSQLIAATLPLGADNSTRKSDDRDSGTVVEPEASVLDFDSSVLTEEENRMKANKRLQKFSINVPRIQEDWSRSGTPILPPLSSEDEAAVLHSGKIPENTMKPLQRDERKKEINIPSKQRKPQNKVKPLQRSNETAQLSPGGVAELSLTESALSDGTARRKSRIKVTSSKLLGNLSSAHKQHRISSEDEQRPQKSRRHKIHDDNATRNDSKETTRRLRDQKKHHRNPSYIGPYRESDDFTELGETSSVHSITTTSVCSSILHKNGTRRHYYRKQYVQGEKYSREIRSVTKRFTRLEAHVVTLARSLAQLSSEIREQNETSREIETLRQQIQEIRNYQMSSNDPKALVNSTSVASKGGKQSKIDKHGNVLIADENPPLLNLFLKRLGYEKYLRNFELESIGMMELPYMDEKRLQDIGIPLGPRLRIMKEAQKSSYV